MILGSLGGHCNDYAKYKVLHPKDILNIWGTPAAELHSPGLPDSQLLKGQSGHWMVTSGHTVKHNVWTLDQKAPQHHHLSLSLSQTGACLRMQGFSNSNSTHNALTVWVTVNLHPEPYREQDPPRGVHGVFFTFRHFRARLAFFGGWGGDYRPGSAVKHSVKNVP